MEQQLYSTETTIVLRIKDDVSARTPEEAEGVAEDNAKHALDALRVEHEFDIESTEAVPAREAA